MVIFYSYVNVYQRDSKMLITKVNWRVLEGETTAENAVDLVVSGEGMPESNLGK